jgi:uncharacterized membrane protein YphA (DoxX/SURF4 family)
MKKNISSTNITSWLLRAGLAIVFLYAGVSSLQHPFDWVSFLPFFLTKAIAATTLIKLFAIYELALAIWLISGKLLKYSSLLCALTLAGIVITNPHQLLTTFRDVGLAFMALALFFAEK